ncbi:MAG: cation-transporting P-type ATPase [Brooklawnia sp.]|uniref:cation-transporting P-type ATPase n=1 Tax=Brooklawnia sp. TaxID=2699740 RepID=UPI003C711259
MDTQIARERQDMLVPETPHALPSKQVLAQLGASDDGLSAQEAATRLESHGPNRLPEPQKESKLKRFFKHFNDALIYVLLAAAVITGVQGHWIDTALILLVVVFNAVIGYVQEGQAENALAGIRQMLSATATARRDGEWVVVDAEDLVPGDLVRLGAGDRVPADVRLLRATDLQVEEAALTGESVPSDKQTDPVDADAGIGDRSSMAFSGTLVTAGTALAVVTGTGQHTEIGKINTMVAEVETLATPLTRAMARFSKVLSLIVVGIAVLLFFIGLIFHDFTLGELFVAAIGFAVATIPEGLPAILTITLARGVQLMAKRNAITRKLNSVETLGSVTTICSDKTGTLTRNEMTVQQVVTISGQYQVTGTGYAPEGQLERDGQPVSLDDHDDLRALITVAGLANDSEVRRADDDWKLLGEPTDGALRVLAMKTGFEAGGSRVAGVPFNSTNKWMATLDDHGGARIVNLKGAPDRILALCSWQGAGPDARDDLDHQHWEDEIDRLSEQGLRVLAAAVRTADDADELTADDVDSGGFVMLGLYGIIDPPRPEAIEAIAECQRAGIDVKMITGDHAGTALAIAREMGIGDGRTAITGSQIEEASDAELQELVRTSDVFARTSPEHKLRLVTALQANGEVGAMTGDGVNDAPSLKRADVGVAMGIKGTEATKEAAEIVLADDNFASIEKAVEMGRTIYDNLRKSIVFILPTNGAEGVVILIAIIAGLSLPLTPVQILWVNMLTSITLSIALAFEPSEPDIMKQPPRDPNSGLLSRLTLARIIYVSLIIAGATLLIFGLTISQTGYSLEVARTMAVNTLVFGQIFYLFNVRYMRQSSLRLAMFTTNPIAWICVAGAIVLQLLFTYVPLLNTALSSAPLNPAQWLYPVGVGLLVFVVVEVEKAVGRARRARQDESADS